MSRVKKEIEEICCCCHSDLNLFNMLEPCDYDGKVETYSTMIAECFGIEIENPIDNEYKHLYVICKTCITHLRDAFQFRIQIENAYQNIQDIINSSIRTEVSVEFEKKYSEVESNFSPSNMKIEMETDYNDASCSNINSNRVVNDANNFQKSISIQPIFKKDEKLKTKYRDERDPRFKKEACNLCGKSYSRRTHLKRHMLTHTGSKDFECKICLKTFLLKSTLNRHMRIHEDVTTLFCNQCGKAFVEAHDFEKHLVSHIGEKKFRCEICGKLFRTRKNLKDHRVIHGKVLLGQTYLKRNGNPSQTEVK